MYVNVCLCSYICTCMHVCDYILCAIDISNIKSTAVFSVFFFFFVSFVYTFIMILIV